jgi:hypothetical protein
VGCTTWIYPGMELFKELLPLNPIGQSAIRALCTHCARPHTTTYPFGNPVSAERSHMDILAKVPYLVADKSDGVRVCVLFGCHQGVYVAALQDRTGRLYGVEVSADAALFQGTMLDAELVRTGQGVYALLVFDACCIAGSRQVEHMPLTDRLEALRTCTTPEFLRFANPNLSLSVKPMFDVLNTKALEAHLRGLPYETDGFILTPDQEPASGPGTAPGILKLKTHHTLDFMWMNNMLWFGDTKDLFPVASVQLAFEPAQLVAVPPGAIVEMTPQTDRHGNVVMLHYCQTRPDKDTPNGYITVTRTLHSIRDNVTLAEVVAARRACVEALPPPAIYTKENNVQ